MSVATMGSGAGQAYGTILVLLAATAVVPGVGMVTGPLVGLAGLFLGVQLALGRPTPWVPAWLQQRMVSSDLGPRFSTWIQDRCRLLLHLRPPQIPALLAGLTVAWSSLLLLLPLAFIPFSNTIPSLAVGLVGAGLLAQRSLLGWLGLALAGGYTVILACLGEALFLAAQALFRDFT